MEVLFFIVVGVGFYLYSMFKENQKNYKNNRPNATRSSPQTSGDLKKLEDLLEEFSERNVSNRREARVEKVVEQEEDKLTEPEGEYKPLPKAKNNKYQQAYENLELKEMLQMDNTIESTKFEGSKNYAPKKAYGTDTRLKDNYQPNKAYSIKKNTANKYKKMLQSSTGKKDAIVLSELLNSAKWKD